MSLRIHGVGCSLMDYLYTGISIDGPQFGKYLSRRAGDGGLVPGGLVFATDLASFAGKPYAEIKSEMTGASDPASRNLGGPAVVAMVHVAQLLSSGDSQVAFYGVHGDDPTGSELLSILTKTPLDYGNYLSRPGVTPKTDVFSDPDYDDGRGERTFVNELGVAGDFKIADLDDSFYDAEIALFGGTALTPAFHADLHLPVERAKRNGALTVVNTVYDFKNEQISHDEPWPLGDTETTLANTDILIMDMEESRRLSGREEPESALAWFLERGVSTALITCGPEPLYAASAGGRFLAASVEKFPVSDQVGHDLAQLDRGSGDTTGCGDNFVGGVVASLADQILSGSTSLSLREAVAWGVGSGGFACFYLGGTYLESAEGEKRELVARYVQAYREQIGDG